MNNGIEEKEVISVESGKHTGTPSSTESENYNCIQDNDQDEKHTSSSKNKTRESSFEEFNADISDLAMEKLEVKTVQWLHGNIKTQNIVNEGFQHVFIMESTSSTLKLRNCDQLLCINDVDVTLKPNKEVLEFLEKIPLDEKTTLIYWRPSSNSVTEVKFYLFRNGGTIEIRLIKDTSFLVVTDWNMILERTVVLNKSGTDKFMQHLKKPSNNIVFEGLVSGQPHTKACEFPKCRFLEKRRIESTKTSAFFTRRFSTISENEKKYLHVTDDGDLNLLNEFSKSSDFKLIPACHYAFFVVNEIPTNRCLKVEKNESQFVCVNYEPVDKIGDDFRFQLFECGNKM
ncbi:uncharacterized protein LOC127739067 isoform X1 [Mytilus californianus]|uniref:uncharacterized protein LOC127739067 isoform X1 n=1 Tax=Mytilus californianus TaxID=6549 RepID=UPI0022470B28|nr:uncharacterized protein LOC127739067 isoform X1 [Mytilus californianus]